MSQREWIAWKFPRIAAMAILVSGAAAADPSAALAAIDSFTLRHVSGPCSGAPFHSGHISDWANRSRIWIGSGERISVTLYGHGADLARDVTGSGIHEWIEDAGTTTDYPGATNMFGGTVPKGYVTIHVRAAASHGTGNRTITVKWLTGTERLSFKIEPDCSRLTTAPYRSSPIATGGIVQVGGRTGSAADPNLLPTLRTPLCLTRPLTEAIATPEGGMVRLQDCMCRGIQVDDVVTSVSVPDLGWGVARTSVEVTSAFDVALLDVTQPSSPVVLETFHLPQGFPPNTPNQETRNYPGRPTTIRVVKNPRFRIGSATQTFLGCFTEPGSTPKLDPGALLIQVDPGSAVTESSESDNDQPF
jgi:hypothetical protein